MTNYLEILNNLSSEEIQRIAQEANAALAGVKFIPNPGPQTDAYFSQADVLLYGGSAGSGKTGLILGLALSQHEKSLILRPSYTDLYALTEDAIRLNGTKDGFTGGTRPRLKTSDGRTLEFGAVGDNVDSWKGQPHDLLAYDELTDFREADFRFLQTWVRSVKKGQRTRVIGATNPPTSSSGDWVIGYWRPWLDPTYENPAEFGELRWCVTDPDGKDMWVDGPTPILFPGEVLPSIPKSRTFIPGKLSDNPYLKDTDYKATLDALPEPLRSAMRDGNFMMARTDQENQVIPLQWIRMAQARWAAREGKKRAKMATLGCDPSCGGIDDTVLAPLRENLFFEKLQTKPGKEMKEGSDVAAFAIKNLRDGAVVGMDMGGGYGGAPKVHLSDSGVRVLGYKGATATTAKDATKTLGFVSLAAESLWRIREALDPDNNPIMALPDDPLMVSELCAYTFETVRQDNQLKIKITTKEEVKKKLGRSPGRGDGVRIAYWAYLKLEKERANDVLFGRTGGKIKVNIGHEKRKRRRK